MGNDPIERLRRLNPIPDTPTAPPIAPLLARLGERHHGEQHDPGDIANHSQNKRWRGGVRAGISAAPIALAVVASIVVAVLALSLTKHASPSPPAAPSPGFHVPAGLPPVPSLSPGDMHALDYHWNTRPHVPVRGNACAPTGPSLPASTQPGPPSNILLATYSVLQTPLTSSNAIPGSAGGGQQAKYGRIAQRHDGYPIEVIPARYVQPQQTPLTARCENAQLAAKRADLAGAPPALIDRALRIEQENFEDERYTQRHPDGVCVSVGSGEGCGSFLSAQARGMEISVPAGSHRLLFVDLVPNGVAKVRVEYPAANPSTPATATANRNTLTVPVINNVAAWTVSTQSKNIEPHDLVWLAHNGKTIRTTY